MFWRKKTPKRKSVTVIDEEKQDTKDLKNQDDANKTAADLIKKSVGFAAIIKTSQTEIDEKTGEAEASVIVYGMEPHDLIIGASTLIQALMENTPPSDRQQIIEELIQHAFPGSVAVPMSGGYNPFNLDKNQAN